MPAIFEFECDRCRIEFQVESNKKPEGLSCPDCACDELTLLSYMSEKSLSRLMQSNDIEARILTIESFLKNKFKAFSDWKTKDWGA